LVSPLSTTCDPPVNTVAPLAKPKTSCSPPEMSAPRSVPPAETTSVPPLEMMVERPC
jgi:hypothetical protein